MGKISTNGKIVPPKQSSPSPNRSHKSPTILSKLLKSVLIVLSFIGYACLIPLFILLLHPLFIYRFIVVFLAKIFRPDLIKIVCTRDGVVGLDDLTKKCQCVLNIMLTFQGEADLEQIRHIFQTKVMDVKYDKKNGKNIYEKFTHYYESWLGYAFWKKEANFNLNDHVRYCEETEALSLRAEAEGNNNNNDKVENFVSEEQLLQIMGPISTRHFRKGMSPWEVLIVRNFVPSPGKIHTDVVPTIEIGSGEETKKFVLILRLHHAISDGYSIMKLIMTNLSNEPMSRIPSPPVRKMGYFELAMMYIGIAILSPYYHLKQFVIDVDRNFWHMRENRLTNDWHCIRSERISMAGLKEVSKVHGVTTTAVLLTGFGSGICKFLKETGQEDKMPKVMRALAPMPWKDHPMNGLVNHWTLGFMVLPIGIDCLQKKLRVAEESIQLLKKSPILYTNFLTVPMLLAPPSWLIDIWATNWMTTIVLSNFPGPNFPIKSFDQNYLDDVTFWLPTMRGSSSLGVAFLSYNGAMRLTATIDRKIVPTQFQADLLTTCINQELLNMRSIVSLSDNIV